MKKLLTTLAALACGTTLAVAGAGPAQAATADCDANSFCLYNEPYPTSIQRIFSGNGTTMFNNPNVYFYSEALKSYAAVYVVNKTQGYFCTYNPARERLGRFAPGTSKVIPPGRPYGHDNNVLYVKYCQNG